MDNQPQPGNLLQQHALPTPASDIPPLPAATPKHFLAAFFLSFFLGVFGADRFYLGYYVSGALKLLTFGWLGIGAIVDLALIMNGALTDSRNRPLAGYPEYKGLAKRTVMWVSLGCAIIVIISVAGTAVAIEKAMTSPILTTLTNPTGGSGSGTPSESSLLNSLTSL